MNLLHSQHSGDYFGNKTVELSGVITDPDYQGKGLGFSMTQDFVDQCGPDRLIAYTRNPAVLRLLGNCCGRMDILDNEQLKYLLTIPHASIEDGIAYHIDRYAPNGLYGQDDPADSMYNGEVLKERCSLLTNKNTALAVSVKPIRNHMP